MYVSALRFGRMKAILTLGLTAWLLIVNYISKLIYGLLKC